MIMQGVRAWGQGPNSLMERRLEAWVGSNNEMFTPYRVYMRLWAIGAFRRRA
jgi:hypothetical protein